MKNQKGVKVIDLGLNKLLKNIKDLTKGSVSVGVHEEDNVTYIDATLVAEVAAFHEYGTVNHPEQVFLRKAAQIDLMKLHGKDFKAFYQGRITEADLMKRIAKTVEAEAKDNIKQAGLIDTGTLLGAVKAKVNKKGDV